MKEGFKDLQRERPKNRTFNLFLSKEKNVEMKFTL
jgi:hypothetical protein